MVQLNKMVGDQQEIRHNLVPKFEDENFPKTGLWCLIQKMSHGVYAVMNYSPKVRGNYYKTHQTIEELNEFYDEIPLV